MGHHVIFCDVCMQLVLNETLVGIGYLLNGFMILNVINHNYNQDYFSLITSSDYVDVNVWHARLGHIGQDITHRLFREGYLGSLDKIELSICESCLVRKTIRKPFGKGTRA